MVKKLVERVAARHVRSNTRTLAEWGDYVGGPMSAKGAELKESAGHLVREGHAVLGHQAMRYAEEIYRTARDLDEMIGKLIIQIGNDAVP